MKEEFVTYEQAKELIELGFDKPCIGVIYPDGMVMTGAEGFADIMLRKDSDCIKAILLSQALRWFRKRGLDCHVKQDWAMSELLGHEGIVEDKDGSVDCGTFDFYELAEQACIDKMIEMETLK
jgi:hypothetical protein